LERSFGQEFDRVWSFLNLFSKRPREQKGEKKEETIGEFSSVEKQNLPSSSCHENIT
jgi:hypothetical protein